MDTEINNVEKRKKISRKKRNYIKNIFRTLDWRGKCISLTLLKVLCDGFTQQVFRAEGVGLLSAAVKLSGSENCSFHRPIHAQKPLLSSLLYRSSRGAQVMDAASGEGELRDKVL